jgi:hypothetical protein
MLDRNGKKDAVREAFTQVLQQNIGVQFEVAAGEEPALPPVPASTARTVPERRDRPGAEVPIAPPAPPGPPAVKVTPELVESLRSDQPLVKALMDNLGATIIKVE